VGGLTLCTLAAGACGAAARSEQLRYPARLRRANAPVSYKCGLGSRQNDKALKHAGLLSMTGLADGHKSQKDTPESDASRTAPMTIKAAVGHWGR
jgi:hypothetical protein